MKKEVLFRVNGGGEFGYGHLKRCIVLAHLLKDEFDPYFLVKGDDKIGEILYKENFNFKLAMHGFEEEVRDIKGLRPNLIFLDVMETPIDFVRKIKENAPVIAFDDRGEGALAADFSICSLPLPGYPTPNLDSRKYLIFDDKINKYQKKLYSKNPRKILVSFGGVDPADLSSVIINAFKKIHGNYDIRLIKGLFNHNNFPVGQYQTVSPSDNIFADIADADLLITSFGMTAYEANCIGTPVLLLNPSEYHETLSLSTDSFNLLGVYDPELNSVDTIARSIEELLNAGVSLKEKALFAKDKIDAKGAQRVVEIIKNFIKIGKSSSCAVCNERVEKSIYRDQEKNMFVCENCLTYSQQYFSTQNFSYDSAYFEDDYAKQYGKTYIEDKKNIDLLNEPRLDIIDKLYLKMQKKFKYNEKKIFEVGAAYGFFLNDANEKGWVCSGVEVAGNGVKFAFDKYGITLEENQFLNSDVESESYNAIVAWYVIEHLPMLNQVMEKIFKMLKKGGIIAFSTPNNRGISARKYFEEYLVNHPVDHYFDFNVKSLKKLLKRYRFNVVKVRITGIHYKRFLGDRQGSFWDNKFFENIYKVIARLFKLGDTFEIYATKK